MSVIDINKELISRKSSNKRYRRSDNESTKRILNRKLLSAVEANKLEKVKKHLQAGADVNTKDIANKNNTPLHYAVKNGNKEIVDWLLQCSADKTIENSDHKTPLILAKELDYSEIITALEAHPLLERMAARPINQHPLPPLQQPAVLLPPSQLEAGDQNILPPFSEELAVDNSLQLSRENFKQSITAILSKQPFKSVTEQLNGAPVYPPVHIFAIFASKAYEDYRPKEKDRDYEKRLELPNGWKLLTTATNTDVANGYFGAAYWHPERRQVVIAHRGTKPTTVGADWADLKGVVFNNYVAQMSSASTFADKISQVLMETLGNEIQLFFTGHSLGGWLAQVTTFSTEYLERKETQFLKRESPSYHAHAVVFDSPGCEAMLAQMRDGFDVRYAGRSIVLESLDITSYLSAPNRINTCNAHIGTVYRVFTDLSSMSWHEKITATYNTATHSMDKILQAFKTNSAKLATVIDWPISSGLWGGAEYKEFFKWAAYLNDYHPEQIANTIFPGHTSIRYQTKLFDEKTCHLSVFTRSEKEFLERYYWLRKSELPIFKPAELLKELVGEKENAQKLLQDFTINEETIRCSTPNTLQKVIPYVQRLLKLYPTIAPLTQEALSSEGIINKIYQLETDNYRQEMSTLDFAESTLDLHSFLSGAQRVWHQISPEETRIGTARTYSALQKIRQPTTFTDTSKYTLLKLKRLLTVHQQVDIQKLFRGSVHLLIIECKALEDTSQAQTLFTQLFATQSTAKLILVSSQQDEETMRWIRAAKDTAQLAQESYLETTLLPFAWHDLTTAVQQQLLQQSTLLPGKQQISLGELLGDASPNELTAAAILQLVNAKDEFTVGHEPLRLSDIDAAYHKRLEPIESANLHRELVDNPDTLFIISDLPSSIPEGFIQQLGVMASSEEASALKERISSQVMTGKNIIVAAGDYQESQFKDFCRQYPARQIQWLSKTRDGQWLWQQQYDPNFYIKRQLNRIAVPQAIKNHLATEAAVEFFVVSQMTQEQVYKLLKADPSEKQRISRSARLFVFENPAEADAKFNELIHQQQTVYRLDAITTSNS